MTKVSSKRALKAILALDADDSQPSAAQERKRAALAPPTLNERVDLFLRAMHGSTPNITAKERSSARIKILSTIANDLFGDIEEGQIRKKSTKRRASFTAATMIAPTRDTLASFIEKLRDAALFPLIWSTHTGRQARFVTALLAVLLISGAAWSATWFYAARSTETAVASWVDSEAKSGRTYDCSSRKVGGFPLHIELSCADPTATLASSEQSTVIVNAKQLKVVASLLRPDALTADIIGPVSVAEPGQPAKFVGNWTTAEIALRGTPNDPKQLSVVLDGAQFYRVSQISMQPLLTGDRLELDARANATSTASKPVFDVVARIAAGSIPEGGSILSEQFTANISAVLRDVGNPAPKALYARLQDWQANGGRVDVTAATIQQGSTSATAQGTLGLASNGGIDGDLSFTAGNLDRIAELLSGNGSKGRDAQQIAAAPALNETQSTLRSITPEKDVGVENKKQEEVRRVDRLPVQPGTIPAVVRFSNGDAYFGSILLGKIPPLF